MPKPWQFQRGNRANPHGRPTGSRNKSSALLDQIADGQAADLLKVVIRRARRGDMKAAALVLSRVWPQRKASVRFTLPQMTTTADLPAAIAAIMQQVADGTLAPGEAGEIAALLSAQRQAFELAELARRIAALERRNEH